MRMLDLFSGIGGFSLAADWTGCIETVAFCEIEPYCQKVLKKHWPDVPIFSDIKELKGEQIGQPIDIVCGGFPCQPFSVAGKRRAQNDDRHLWPEMFRVIQECKPTWVIGENVTGLIELALEECFVDLETEGYEVQPLIIPACAVNAPHRRDRVWVIAYTDNDGPHRPEGIKTEQDCNQPKIRLLIGNGEDVADTHSERLQGEQKSRSHESEWKKSINQQSMRCNRANGDWWEIEPDVGRVANGIPSRTHRLKALGNSIVPQVAYQILQGIVDIERSKVNEVTTVGADG